MKKTLLCLFSVLLCGAFLPVLAGACGGDTGLSCPEGQFCKLPLGSCDSDAEGVCTDMPLSCGTPDIPEWVCDCDGVDFGLQDESHVISGRERYLVLPSLLASGFHRIGVYDRHFHVDVSRRLPGRVIWTGKSQ